MNKLKDILKNWVRYENFYLKFYFLKIYIKIYFLYIIYEFNMYNEEPITPRPCTGGKGPGLQIPTLITSEYFPKRHIL